MASLSEMPQLKSPDGLDAQLRGAHVENAILFENVDVGRHARLRNCIIDKDIVIPEGMHIGYDEDFDREHFTVSEGGVVVISKGTDLSALAAG